MCVCVYTLTGSFIRYTLLVPGWPSFCLQNCLNSLWHRFNKVLEIYSSEILVHIDMIATHSCCRFVGCTSMMWISRSTTSQRCSTGLRSGNCGGYLSKWTHYVQETSLRWFELCDMVHYPAGSSIRRRVHCSHEGMDMVNNTQVVCGV